MRVSLKDGLAKVDRLFDVRQPPPSDLPPPPMAANVGTIASIMQPDGTLRCRRCGSTALQPKRSTGRKVALGFASLLGGTNEIRCLVCNAKYR